MDNPNLPPKETQQSRGDSGMVVNTSKLVAESGYHNPDPLVQLLGCANETKVVVEGVEMRAMVNTGSPISAIIEGFCTEMGLEILPLRNLMGVCCVLRGWGCFDTIQMIHGG